MEKIRAWWLYRKSWIIAGVIVIVAAGTVALSWPHAEQGRMSLSKDAIDVSNRQVNEQSVQYYSEVCDSINDAHRAQLALATTMADGIGADDPATLYSDGIRQARDSLLMTTRRLDDANHTPELTRADNVKVSYAGAVDPLVSVVNNGIDDLRRIEASGDITSNDAAVRNKSMSAAVSAVTEVPSTMTSRMSEVVQRAPLMTEATKEAVFNLPTCRSIFSPIMGDEANKNVIVTDIVDARVIARDAHEQFGRDVQSLMKLNSLADEVRGKSGDEVNRLIASAFEPLLNNSRDSAQRFDQWHVTTADDAPATVVSREYEPHMRDGASVFHRAEQWADEMHTTVVACGADESCLADALRRVSEPLKEITIAEAQWHTRMMTQTQLPNNATADEVKTKAAPSQDT